MKNKLGFTTLALAGLIAATPAVSLARDRGDFHQDNRRAVIERHDVRHDDRGRYDRGGVVLDLAPRVYAPVPAPAPAAGYYDQFGVWHPYGYYDQFGVYHAY